MKQSLILKKTSHFKGFPLKLSIKQDPSSFLFSDYIFGAMCREGSRILGHHFEAVLNAASHQQNPGL